jgi:hypothetical protein
VVIVHCPLIEFSWSDPIEVDELVLVCCVGALDDLVVAAVSRAMV